MSARQAITLGMAFAAVVVALLALSLPTGATKGSETLEGATERWLVLAVSDPSAACRQLDLPTILNSADCETFLTYTTGGRGARIEGWVERDGRAVFGISRAADRIPTRAGWTAFAAVGTFRARLEEGKLNIRYVPDPIDRRSLLDQLSLSGEAAPSGQGDRPRARRVR